jgi:CBS domain containing-hemolysin-like protein
MILIIIKLLVFIILLTFVAFFSAVETALTSLSHSHVRRLKEKYNKFHKYIYVWEKNPEDIITTILVCMNMSVVAVGVVTTSLGLSLIEYFTLNKTVWVAVFTILSIITVLIFGSIIPKTIARYNVEMLSLKTLPVLVRLSEFTSKLNIFLVSISTSMLNFFGKNTAEPTSIEADEIDFLLSNAEVSPLSPASRKIIKRIIEFRKTKVTQVMVPRSEILAVDINQPQDKVIEDIIATQFTRVPIYKESMNNIIGIIHIKDLAMTWRSGGVLRVEDIIKPVYYVPETAHIKQLFINFQKNHQHIAIIVDEFGSTIGLVTIEDILEEIIGEVWDEYDIQERNIVKLKENEYIINASESIANVNDELKMSIPEEHFSTINGWVLECFGYIPRVYEKTTWKNYEIEIDSATSKKIKRIILRKKENVL